MNLFGKNIPSSNGKALSLGTFFLLYIAQSVPMSFFSTAIQVLMRQSDFSLSSIAMLQFIKVPWILKFLWSPSVDRHCVTLKDFKRFILISEIVYAVLILSVAFFDLKTNFPTILILVFLSLVASATQDIATDALAVLSFEKREKSLVNSMQSMGSFGGTLIGSGVLLIVLHKYGWMPIIPALAALALIAVVPLMLNRQLRITPKSPDEKVRYVDIVMFFARKSIWRQIGFLILYYASIIGILSVLRPYLVDLGYSIQEIGVISGILGTSTAFVCSFGAGLFVKRVGRFLSRIVFAVFILMTTLYFLYLSFIHPTTLLLCIGVCLLWSSYGMASVLVYTTSMDCVRKGREGTDFTIQTVITHLSGLLIALHCGNIADKFGYRGLFSVEVFLAALSLCYILYFFRKERKKDEN